MKNTEETDKNRQASNEPEGAIAIKYFTPSGLSIGQLHLSSHICDVGRKRVKNLNMLVLI